MGTNVTSQQTTLREKLEFSGVGVHSGERVNMVLLPADANTGIIFNVAVPGSPTETVDLVANLGSIGAWAAKSRILTFCYQISSREFFSPMISMP